jgi:class 3 adenylate cyclase/CHASE2 domain-containing sensor protein
LKLPALAPHRLSLVSRTWLPWAVITVVTAFVANLGGNMPLMVTLDGAFYDQGITATAKQPPADIVIVGLTEEFTDGKHVALLPREKLARLIDTLSVGKPAIIGVDWWLDSYVDAEENPRGKDAQLRQALLNARRNGVPIVLNQVNSDAGQSEAQLTQGADTARSGLNTHGSTIRYFAEAASAIGGIDFTADSDGIYRDLPVTSKTHPSLPWQLATFYLRKKGKPLPDSLHQRLQSQATPIDFCAAPGQWNVVPADKVLSEPALAFLMADKIVLIGGTFPRSGDFIPSPYDQFIHRRTTSSPTDTPQNTAQSTLAGTFSRQFYGVEMLANATATILRGAPRYSADTTPAQRRVAWLALGVAALVTAAALRGIIWGVLAMLLAIIGSIMLAALSARDPIALLGFHYWKASPSILASLLAFTASTAYRQITIGRELRRVKTVFGGYVGPKVLQQLGGRMPELGGETWNIAVLFCDIEGFTSLSESMREDPQRLLGTLNEHFAPLVKALQDRGAHVDNYVGDLVMALFGAPLPAASLSIDTRNAVWAAIDFINIVKERNKERCARGETPINVGIGVHCGPAVVGNMGSQERMHYTAIGDTVNLASRVESATRHYHTPLLVTEEVVNAFNEGIEELPPEERLEWEFVAETTVKNRASSVCLYRPRV